MKINWKRIPAILRTIAFEVSVDPGWTPYGLVITPAIEDALHRWTSQICRTRDACLLSHYCPISPED